MKVAAHLRFSARSRWPCKAQAEAGGHSRGLRTTEVPHQWLSLHQMSEDGEGTRSKVYQMDDVVGWTCVVSLFVNLKGL
jgi:hypothetical protein